MSSPQKQQEKTVPFQSMLLSPPEAKRSSDVFSSPVTETMSQSSSQDKPVMSPSHQDSVRSLISPPISPAVPQEEVIRADEGARDPPLFPQEESDLSRSPLFPTPDSSQQAQIERHVAQNGRICQEEDYKVMLDACSQMKFTSNVSGLFQGNRQKLWQHSQETMAFYDRIRAEKKAAEAAKIKKAAPTHRTRALAPAPEGGVRKKVTTPRVRRSPKPKPAVPQHTFAVSGFSPSVPAPKVKAAISSRDDVDFNQIPDYCPPTAGLTKPLKAEWRGTALDLSDDPDRHLLHEAEVHLAATLRLSCAVYLSSKRRIFEARVLCGRRGKEFKKTDAQQACKIDVNKASRLWGAFEKVGWFDERHFVGFM